MTYRIYLTLLLLVGVAFAQPRNDWMRTYHLGGVHEAFYDIYKVSNGGYVTCGSSEGQAWIVRLNNDGEVVWSNLYGERYALTIIETDEGDFIAGRQIIGDDEINQIAALVVDDEGEVIWQNSYGPGTCYAIIELKDGAFLLAGSRGEGSLVVMIEHNGDDRWQRVYHQNAVFRGMRETAGGVVLSGYLRVEQNDYRYYAVKINLLGELLWSRIYDRELGTLCYSMDSAPDNGFLLAGSLYPGQNHRQGWDIATLKINAGGDVEWNRIYPQDGLGERCNGCCRINDNGFAFVGSIRIEFDHVAYRVTPDGAVRWRHRFNFGEQQDYLSDRNEFNSVIVGHDNALLAAGTIACADEQLGSNGIIVKLEPEILGPYFIAWSPEDTVFTTLLGDTVAFSVEALNQQGDELSYAWYYADTLRGQNTDFEMVFDSLGVFEVQCQASDAEFTASITWHITVSDFFIRETTPDTLHITARRGNTLAFTLGIACVEPDAPSVEWTVVNRDNDREYLGEADTINVLFDLAGEWAVEAEANWNGEQESVRWAVDVRSAVWWWMPHEEAISVNQNEHREFSVFPFEPDSDSLSVAWWLDGDSLESSAEALSLDFPDLGEYTLVSIVRDGVETDTIRWAITVNESGVATDRNGIPTELALYPPAPNPFNSTTTIGFSLPVAGMVSLTVYDLAGREVARLVDAVKAAGTHEAVWQADGMASGVYVVKLDAGGVMLREKVVLVK